MRGYKCHEKIKVHRTTNRLRFEAGETGIPVAEVCRRIGISEATFFNWKRQFSGLGTTKLRRLRQLEVEKARLKLVVADLTLDKQMLQDVLKKKL